MGYLHDQTLRMLNRGLVGPEIAEQLTPPPGPGERLAHPRRLRLGQPQHRGDLTAARRDPADVTLATTRRALPALALGGLSPDKLAEAGIELSGDSSVLARLGAVLDPGDPDFAIVTP